MRTARISYFDEINIDYTELWTKLYQKTYELVSYRSVSPQWNEMLPVKKIGTNYIFWPLIGGYAQTCLKWGGRVTQTSFESIFIFFAGFYIICVCWTRICRITFYNWCPSPLNKQSKKCPPKPHLFIFLLNIIARFLFSPWFGVDKLMSHVFAI